MYNSVKIVSLKVQISSQLQILDIDAQYYILFNNGLCYKKVPSIINPIHLHSAEIYVLLNTSSYAQRFPGFLV